MFSSSPPPSFFSRFRPPLLFKPEGREGRKSTGQDAGFTLIELLAVLAILALLMSLSMMVFGGGQEKAYRASTAATIAELEMLISAYEGEHGDYPSDRLRDYKIKAENNENEGIEACLAALHGKGHPKGRSMNEKSLANTDEDETSTAFHRDGSPALLEVVDAWGNPIAYFHNRNYESPQNYLLSEPEYRDEPNRDVYAAVSGMTKVFANPSSYQLISAGVDEEFGTEDDITNFKMDD